MNKVDLITDCESRWKLDHAEIPKQSGQLSDLNRFDAIFFGVHYKQAHTIDPMYRMAMECSYEAIIDAGVNPRTLKGTNTAVVMGACISESEKTWFYEKLQADGLGITGCSKTMLPNRISYYLGIHGPSYVVDTACSSSLVSLDHAYRMIRTGVCDAAIIGGCNLCLHPYLSLQFARLGVLSPDCRCKTFDESANGYVRSEAVSVIYLQKAKNANRIYAQVVYTKTNCDGYKEQGISFPSTELQRTLLSDFYSECKISPNTVFFVEAHGTGTSVGDPQELNAIEKIFCQNRKTPLKIGSIKSNLGHTEPASGMCSLAKVLIAMESGVIPPNLHFKKPSKGIKCFDEKTAEVVTEPTPWNGGYCGINSFGFGGVNAHALLKSYTKEKVNNGAPSDDLPRVVAVSGRTQEAVETLLDYVESIPIDVEYIQLLHYIYAENVTGHLYRGYTVVGSKTAEKPPREIKEYSDIKRPLWFIFSGMGSQWVGMGEALMKFPIFAKAIEKCDAALKPHGIDIVDIITTKDKNTFENIINCFVGIAAIQIGLVDLLSFVGIKPDNMIGHSVGELGCAYADNCFTAEQMVLAAYFRGRASLECKMTYGSMAAVGLGHEETKDLCPPDIDVACHNSSDSCTISGPAESMKEFVAKLQAKKIFAKEVACGNIAFHSRYIAGAGEKLLESLKKVIPKPKLRSSKWISTSVPRNKWDTEAAMYCSAEYHTNNLLSSVLFAEMSTMIPADAITIEIAPHGLLQAILRRSLSENATKVSLMQRGYKDNAEYLLEALGKLYNAGLQPQFTNIYPQVEFPVSRGTPMVSPHIKWEHSENWFTASYSQQEKNIAEQKINVNLQSDTYNYMVHYKIDGKNLIPPSGYLIMVWETFSLMQNKTYNEVPVVFQNIKFERTTIIPPKDDVALTIMIQTGSGLFEISEELTTVATGTIHLMTNPSEEMIAATFLTKIEDNESLNSKDIYKELQLRGYNYTGVFRALKSSSINGTRGRITWFKNWAAFIDNMLQMKILSIDTRIPYIPTEIRKLVIDVKAHNNVIQNLTAINSEIPVYMYKDYDAIIAGGIEIRGFKAKGIQRRKLMSAPVLEEYKFIAHRDKASVSLETMVILSTHLALESHIITSPKIFELIHQEDKLPILETLTPTIIKVLSNLPTIRPELILAANTKRAEKLSLPKDVTVTESNKLPKDGSVFMVVAYDILSDKRSDILKQILVATNNHGFILLREKLVDENSFPYLKECGLNIVLEKRFNDQHLLLLKKRKQPPQNTEVVYVKNNEFDWLEKVKAVLKNEKEKKVKGTVRLVLVAEKDMENGILGMVKCLRQEPCGEIVKTVIIQDKNAPKFSLTDPFYSTQLDLDIGYNVLRPRGAWGTYRHVPYSEMKPIPVTHGYVDIKVKGNLSSLQWVEGPIRPDAKNDYVVKVVYSALNCRDMLIAIGKLLPEDIAKNRKAADCMLGYEFSGIDINGRRIMGFVESKAISNLVTPSKYTVWPVPDKWSLEDAATIPSAYFTVFYAFYQFGKLKKGEKVLIHAGSGAVGQAAIRVALSEGCEVFTTVSSEEKRQFIRKTFPEIKDSHIGNSTDTSFEQMVMNLTCGKGVDIVLNSLTEEKLQASARCIGYRGRFLQIGKFDLAANNDLGLGMFLKEAAFHGINLDELICADNPEIQKELHHFMNEKLNSDVIKPLVRKCFEKDQVEEAFRYMITEKHFEKILIKISNEEESFSVPIVAHPRFNAIKNGSYVLITDSTGIGMEFVDWLILRGARNIIIVFSNVFKTGYQKLRTEIWKSYGVKVVAIGSIDVTKPADCEFVLKTAEKQAPVDGIFNLAGSWKDCPMENQTAKSFEESMKQKAGITKQLDELSRKICPYLQYFVVFSSWSCGRGTPGQTNYGMGNAMAERICERRMEAGFHGMAIQWGPLADAEIENDQQLTINRILPQSLSSCFEELDKFLTHSKPIVSSMIIAKERSTTGETNYILQTMMDILNINDLKAVNKNSSLVELGVNAMMAMEIQQTLKRKFEISLTLEDIRNLTIAKLIEISTKDTKKQIKTDQKAELNNVNLTGMQLLMKNLGSSILNNQYCVQLSTEYNRKKKEIFFIPGIEGTSEIFQPLVSKLKHPATCLQLRVKDTVHSVENIAEHLLPHLLARNKNSTDFVIAAYSYGSLIALEVVRKLEELGLVGRLILIDGSPDYMKAMKSLHFGTCTENEYQNKFITDRLNNFGSSTIKECQSELEKCTSWNEKLDVMVKHTPDNVRKIYSPEAQKTIISFVFKRLCLIDTYEPSTSSPLRTPITLLVPMVPAVQLLDPTYGLSKLTYGKVTVHEFEGNHLSILKNEKIAMVINDEPIEDEEAFIDSLQIHDNILTC
ncbi:fatty acid synthase-like [Xylocopa sonorina]|uniref:fatty acid synthase-like n=1 Tax=Xylocopa sonorina TaxID=1818115 RepID=UPI00403AEF2F